MCVPTLELGAIAIAPDPVVAAVVKQLRPTLVQTGTPDMPTGCSNNSRTHLDQIMANDELLKGTSVTTSHPLVDGGGEFSLLQRSDIFDS